ncbi:hypothetical protein BLNAU_23936 [Blattamonas nauphoetae]|uniref:Uncharacterized protein n=1 Tax=Blattamonas nauphoetae TaxID=2049346 RepID=A0ABQ9WRS9_9EUKA|nr:hypothetical protein BLNAU_23936 [Blattamonas nauphoetae]
MQRDRGSSKRDVPSPTLPLCSSSPHNVPSLPSAPSAPKIVSGLLIRGSTDHFMRSEPIENMDASSCCLSSGVAVVYVEPADLCAPSSLAISGLSTLHLLGTDFGASAQFFLSPNLRRVVVVERADAYD